MQKYLDKIIALKESLTQQVDQLSQDTNNLEVHLEICSNMQKEMLDLALLINNDPLLQDADIMTWFDLCYELCQQFIDGKLTEEAYLGAIKHMLYTMDEYTELLPNNAHEVSIAAIIKNERNIIEWIEYHLLIGVSHFYIYDNESTDGLKEKIQSYIDDGVITYIYYPGKHQQHASYRHAIEHFKYETKWLAIIDGDEYLVPIQEGQTLPEVINEIVHNWKNHKYRNQWNIGAIGVNWRDYGTSGHKTPVDGLITENYMYRAEDDYFQNVHIKSIYNPRAVATIYNPHFGEFIPGWVCISEKGSMIPGSYFYDNYCEKIRINHYFSKSEEELVAKNKRGWPDWTANRDDSKELYEATINCNKIYDPIMERYLIPLKERLAFRQTSKEKGLN